jgi:hypothetical protein
MQKHRFLDIKRPDDNNYKFISLRELNILPKDLQIPHPNSWSRETRSWFSRMFSFDLEEYYEDEDKLRHKREAVPGSIADKDFNLFGRSEFIFGDVDFSYNELDLVAPYLSDRHSFRMFMSIPPSFRHELLALGCSAYDSDILIRYGFHYEEDTPPIANDIYFKGFPYAPKPLYTDLDGSIRPVTSYAGSFSIAVSTYNPPVLFTSWDTFNEDQFLDNLQTFKQKCSFYTVLKPGLEDIFQQPVDLFLGAWY